MKIWITNLLVSLVFIALPAWAMNQEAYKISMDQLVQKLPAGSDLSLHIELLGTGTELYSKKSEHGLTPASAMKLLVSVAALDTLGPAYQFETKVFGQGQRQANDLTGNLVLRGNGDPFLVSERLWLLARDVARGGIRHIRGGIAVDNDYFGTDSLDLLKWGDSGEKYATVVSATSLNFNNLEVHAFVKEGRVQVETGPVSHGYAILRNQVKLKSGQSGEIVVVPKGKEGNKEVFLVQGHIGKGSPPIIQYAPVHNSASYIAHVFAALLRKEGIQVDKEFVGLTKIGNGGTEIASLKSLPLLDLVRSYNTYSNNFMTEQLFQAWGAFQKGEPASTEKSRASLTDYLSQQGICKGIKIDNGSGLSWDARVNAKCFVDLLQKSYRAFRIFADLLGSMPVGRSTGTLKNRFKEMGKDFDPLKVRAKTGTLWSVRPVTSLVGFTQTKSGETAVYAILLNNDRANPALLQPMRNWEDACLELLQKLQL